MREIIGNVWKYHDAGNWIAITTNGTVMHDYDATKVQPPRNIMGAGVAKQAKERFSDLPLVLGTLIESHGNIVHRLPQYRLYSLPVKFDWWLKADIGLIIRSCNQLAHLAPEGELTYMVRPGCGLGRLAWRDVKPRIEDLLDNRFVVVELPK